MYSFNNGFRIRNKSGISCHTYQYFTEADLSKLRSIGYATPMTPLEEGVGEYVQQYLMQEKVL